MNKMKQKGYQTARVVKNTRLTPTVYKIELAPTDGEPFTGEPGQFCMLKLNGAELFLARPLSIYDLEEGRYIFLYLTVGRGTEFMAELTAGETLEVLGPLGNGFPVDKCGPKTALVAGGIGLAPMYYLAKALKRAGRQVDLYVGFSKEVYELDCFAEWVDHVHVATDDGHYGHRGFVTDLIPDTYDTVCACGPEPMFSSLAALELSADSYYSMERHMACGIGICFGCTLRTGSTCGRVCVEGPVYNGKEVYLGA